ncbi:uncharacterized protein HMPREF1541_01785 [Cyphellophora europaea CBS 101466]|uniref:Uncharacterized protein n=1 Tax=Cyphellophora europaea (strain CBS 101466) TaxID=1220924 RepID=W2S3L1_CYPE1|nr:uncharacterized protein HMPREF1541_01785 [Cyphellophora europaea CBS 101466]ETN42628.1 hypothetical protein HMPREF1541_01785 [Cyphellophora europaea CBS 101466]
MASSSTLLFLDLPPGTFIGIDLLSFNSSPNFHGVIEVPIGIHFIYTGTDASVSIRNGRWLNIESSSTTHTFQWNAEDESLSLITPDSPTAQHALSTMPSLPAHGLITYPALEAATSNLQAGDTSTGAISPIPASSWTSLVSHISSSTIARITPTGTLTSISSAPADSEADSIPGLTRSEALSALPSSTNLNLLPIDLKRTWAEGDVGVVRTERARDRSWYLHRLLGDLTEGYERHISAREVLGELQFCYVMVMVLANWSCLEGWKRIISVVFTCRIALREAQGWFVEVVRVLKFQLERAEDVEGGVFELREEGASGWLKVLLKRFRENVEDSLDPGSKLEQELQSLEEVMRERYGWEVEKTVLKRGMVQLEDGEMLEVSLTGADEDEEKGDWAPVVVET